MQQKHTINRNMVVLVSNFGKFKVLYKKMAEFHLQMDALPANCT